MEPGKLVHAIIIESPVETQNQFGEPITTWEPFASVWAAKADLTGREAYLAQQVVAELTTRFDIRYLDGVTAKHRIISDGTYNIVSIADPDGRKTSLIIMTSRQGV